MAISPISNNQKGFTFAGESSKTYGVYITDGAFYDAPDRDGEMIEIPGRNGAYFLDKGRFKNIEVVYKAAMGAANETDFRDGIAAVRSWLCSKKGYQRLEDEFNPDEYRLAVFKDGAEVRNVDQKTGTFDIIFDCKPQRFLKSGETAIEVEDGDTITNPTLFDASPLLKIRGNGTFGINGDEIKLTVDPLGRVDLYNAQTYNKTRSEVFDFSTIVDSSLYDQGDSLYVSAGYYEEITGQSGTAYSVTYLSSYCSYANATVTGSYSLSGLAVMATGIRFEIGTPSTVTASSTERLRDEDAGVNYNLTPVLTIDYDGNTTISMTVTLTPPEPYFQIDENFSKIRIGDTWIDSSATTSNEDVYIDLEIGEAYVISGGIATSVNNSVVIPAELPVLKPDANSLTATSGLSDIEIKPRWWRV